MRVYTTSQPLSGAVSVRQAFSRRDRSCPNDAPGRVESCPVSNRLAHSVRVPPRHSTATCLVIPRRVASALTKTVRLSWPTRNCSRRVHPGHFDTPDRAWTMPATGLASALRLAVAIPTHSIRTRTSPHDMPGQQPVYSHRHAPSDLVLHRSYLALNDNPFRTVTTGLARACSTHVPSGQAPTTCQVTPLPARRLIFSRQRRIMPSPNDWPSRDKSCRDVPIRQDWSRHSSPGRARAAPIPSCPTDLLRTITRRV